jgi:hypothetical protein
MVGQQRSYLHGDVVKGSLKSKDYYQDIYGNNPAKYGGSTALHKIPGDTKLEPSKYFGTLTTPFR